MDDADLHVQGIKTLEQMTHSIIMQLENPDIVAQHRLPTYSHNKTLSSNVLQKPDIAYKSSLCNLKLLKYYQVYQSIKKHLK